MEKSGTKHKTVALLQALLVTFLLVDGLWLGVIASGFYREHLGYLLAESPDWVAAGAFYLLGMIAVIWFRWIAQEREWEEIERSLVRS